MGHHGLLTRAPLKPRMPPSTLCPFWLATSSLNPCMPPSTPPLACRVVAEKTACVVERFGRFSKTLEPGLHLLIPVVSGWVVGWLLLDLTFDPVPEPHRLSTPISVLGGRP